MYNQAYAKYCKRIKELIEESEKVAQLEVSTRVGHYIKDNIKLNSWLTKTKNIVEITFGLNSPHYKEFERITNGGVYNASTVNGVQGFLIGALDDLEHGLLVGHEFVIAGEVFDSVLEEAKYLNSKGHKDAAAVLGRVVIEDSLKRLARQEEIDDGFKATRLNDELKKINKYTQPQWRLVQAWLDLGNAAAHGQFNDYNDEDIKKMLEGIEQFIAYNF
ncbi:MAG: DUF4145 domain-containing protein [Firmicutes bacterium]|nr:DUF4145 domain-containing protein [Bacillota bacterium]